MPQNEGRVEEFTPANEGFQLTREELKELAEAILDALGLERVERSDEEREVIRRAAEDYRKRKGKGNKGL